MGNGLVINNTFHFNTLFLSPNHNPQMHHNCMINHKLKFQDPKHLAMEANNILTAIVQGMRKEEPR